MSSQVSLVLKKRLETGVISHLLYIEGGESVREN